jgi:hypothetical protein
MGFLSPTSSSMVCWVEYLSRLILHTSQKKRKEVCYIIYDLCPQICFCSSPACDQLVITYITIMALSGNTTNVSKNNTYTNFD